MSSPYSYNYQHRSNHNKKQDELTEPRNSEVEAIKVSAMSNSLEHFISGSITRFCLMVAIKELAKVLLSLMHCLKGIMQLGFGLF